MTAPLVPVALAFGAGVALGLVTPAPAGLVAGGALLLSTTAVVAVRRGRCAAASTAVLALVGLAGWVRVALPDPLPATTGLRPGLVRLEGIVTGEPEREGPKTQVPLLVVAAGDSEGLRPAAGRLAVHLYGAPPGVAPADRIRVTVQLSEARPFRNPGHGAPAAERGGPRFFASGRTDSVERLAHDPVPWWLAVRVRVHRLVQAHLPPVSGALLEGLLLGERRQLPPTLLGDFRAAGVYHILAISGFNVGLVAAAVFFLFRLLRVPARPAAAVALATLAAFAVVVGGQPSVLRAAIMAGLVLTARLIAREAGVWNSLAAALLVLLALDPGSLADPGLQLSFGATAGILHLSPALRGALEARWPRWAATAVAVSAGAQLAVTPLMLVHWSQLSLIGVVANLAVVPLAALLTTLGFVAVLIGGVSDGVAHWVFRSLWALLLGLRLVVRAFAALPGATLQAPVPPPSALAAIALALVTAPLATTGRRMAALLALVALAIGLTVAAHRPDGRLRVVMLDVGQGDAILVRGPDGQALLVDTGGGGPGRADRGERVVLPALRRAGVRRLAALAVTHGDPDHAGGLASLLAGIPIGEVWVPAGTEDAAWHEPAVAARVPRRVLARGDRVWLGPLLVTVLHPPPAHWSADDNNGSLVLRVEWGLAGVLLTGDAEAPAERALMAAGLPLRATLLKLGHHGSRHASSAPFLAAVAPRVGLISVGARNPFGHPSPAALGRLAVAGAGIYRTDYDGAVEVTSDGAELRVRRWGRPGGSEEVIPLRGAP